MVHPFNMFRISPLLCHPSNVLTLSRLLCHPFNMFRISPLLCHPSNVLTLSRLPCYPFYLICSFHCHVIFSACFEVLFCYVIFLVWSKSTLWCVIFLVHFKALIRHVTPLVCSEVILCPVILPPMCWKSLLMSSTMSSLPCYPLLRYLSGAF